MKKPWVYRRKGVKGWWVGWYEAGKRKAKACPNKAVADHVCRLKYTQINSDVYAGTINAEWRQMVEEYELSKHVAGCRDTSIYEALLTLKHFKRLVGPLNSKQIVQPAVDRFVLERGKEVKRFTLNKDISNVRAFLRWGVGHRYVSPEVKVRKVKVEQHIPCALDTDQIRSLLMAAGQRSACWRMRVLLLLATGLRSGDVDKLTVADIDFERNTVDTKSRKTRKRMLYRPLPAGIMPELLRYVDALPGGQERLLAQDSNTHKKWKVIRRQAGLPTLRLHDLRATFASVLQGAGASTAIAQELLEHSDPKITASYYTNVNAYAAEAVNKIPVSEWLPQLTPRVPTVAVRKIPPVPKVPAKD
ncbi:MAG: site-specific integrase [Planctomycetaceae bacterium]|nr:site-specific integrase [Planctomycetaceae bacterium]